MKLLFDKTHLSVWDNKTTFTNCWYGEMAHSVKLSQCKRKDLNLDLGTHVEVGLAMQNGSRQTPGPQFCLSLDNL